MRGTWPLRCAAQAGCYAPTGFGVWPSLIETLQSWARAEAGAGRLLPWVPIAFGTGIAGYFAADREPVLPVAAVAAIVVSIAAFLLRRRKIFRIAVMIAAVAAGFAVATWKAARVAHDVLARPVYSVALSGFVETRDIRERTDRFVLRVVSIESPRRQAKLERVRLSVRKGAAPEVGSFVELLTLATEVEVYFCDPRCPWQRGFNENTNRLLRQYLPRGTDLSLHSQAKLSAIARQLNERPRKDLALSVPS